MKNRGITLVALVITIIVLLILAGVSLSITVGENGVLSKSKEATESHRDAEIEEELKLAYAAYEVEELNNPDLNQPRYVKERLEERYKEEVNAYKSGMNCKVEFVKNKNNKIYVLKYDGRVYHYTRMKKTDVYGKIDDDGVLYLRKNKLDGYKKYGNSASISSDWNDKGTASKESVKRIVIEEPIAPAGVYAFFSGFSNLENIDNIENLHTENTTNMTLMFLDCQKLKRIDLSHFDTQKVTKMDSMFRRCYLLEELDLRDFDMKNVTTTEAMFMDCKNLIKLDMSGFDTDKLNNMTRMFNTCSKLKEIDLKTFTTNLSEDSRLNIPMMFVSCGSVEKINLSGFDTSTVKSMHQLFSGCNSLKELDLSGKFKINDDTDISDFFKHSTASKLIQNGIIIRSSQDTANKIRELYPEFKDENFDIIE